MADDDAWQEDAENVEEGGQARDEEKSKSKRHEEHAGEEKTEAQLMIEAKQRKHEEEERSRLQDLEEQRRIEREKEEDELRRLKEKQAQRKKEREEEERKMEIQRQEAEEQRKREEEQRRQEKEQEKQRKMEEAERKKAAAAAAVVGGRNFTVQKGTGETTMDKFMNISKAKQEMGLNTNELEVLKQRTIEDRVRPLSLGDLDFKGLQKKAEDLWKQIVQLETAKYDLAERAKRQEYDLKELNERQRQTNQKRYAAQGLDVEQKSNHPPKVQIISKYERRTDRRTFGDKKGLYDGSQLGNEQKELNRPKVVRRENWIKAKEVEEKRGSRQYADDEEEAPRYNASAASHKEEDEEEHEQEEVAAEDEE